MSGAICNCEGIRERAAHPGQRYGRKRGYLRYIGAEAHVLQSLLEEGPVYPVKGRLRPFYCAGVPRRSGQGRVNKVDSASGVPS